jgi:hypothetical protein
MRSKEGQHLFLRRPVGTGDRGALSRAVASAVYMEERRTKGAATALLP